MGLWIEIPAGDFWPGRSRVSLCDGAVDWNFGIFDCCIYNSSQPLRWGCGLKSSGSCSFWLPCSSASAMGLWIEICSFWWVMDGCSCQPLRWGCGLKFTLWLPIPLRRASASAMGLWIEIMVRPLFLKGRFVSLCDGAVDWNPHTSPLFGELSASASAMGLWIEIWQLCYYRK